MKRTTIWLEDADYESAEVIQKKWGVSSLGDAIRLALRTMAFGIQSAPGYQTPQEMEECPRCQGQLISCDCRN